MAETESWTVPVDGVVVLRVNGGLKAAVPLDADDEVQLTLSEDPDYGVDEINI